VHGFDGDVVVLGVDADDLALVDLLAVVDQRQPRSCIAW
jgi:hypothetical protein